MRPGGGRFWNSGYNSIHTHYIFYGLILKSVLYTCNDAFGLNLRVIKAERLR